MISLWVNLKDNLPAFRHIAAVANFEANLAFCSTKNNGATNSAATRLIIR